MGVFPVWPVFELHEDALDFAVEILAKLTERVPKRGLHLFAFPLTDFTEPVILEVGQQGQQKNEDSDDNELQRWLSFANPHTGLVLIGQVTINIDSKTRRCKDRLGEFVVK